MYYMILYNQIKNKHKRRRVVKMVKRSEDQTGAPKDKPRLGLSQCKKILLGHFPVDPTDPTKSELSDFIKLKRFINIIFGKFYQYCDDVRFINKRIPGLSAKVLVNITINWFQKNNAQNSFFTTEDAVNETFLVLKMYLEQEYSEIQVLRIYNSRGVVVAMKAA